MDNCKIYKVNGVRKIVSENGHNLLFLPPYITHLNPIEETFSKCKRIVKEENCSTVSDLENAILAVFHQ
jgi:transposase